MKFIIAVPYYTKMSYHYNICIPNEGFRLVEVDAANEQDALSDVFGEPLEEWEQYSFDGKKL